MCVREECNVWCHCLNSCSAASHLTHHLLLCHYCKCQNSEKWQIPYIIMKIILTLTPFCNTLMACVMCIGFKERTWWHHGLQQQTTPSVGPRLSCEFWREALHSAKFVFPSPPNSPSLFPLMDVINFFRLIEWRLRALTSDNLDLTLTITWRKFTLSLLPVLHL